MNPLSNGRITIDLGALARNWQVLAARHSATSECGAVVKANAYGIGIKPAAEALFAAGARTFFVATPDEGLELRAILPKAGIYILNGLYRGSASTYAENALRPVLGSLPEVREWADFLRSSGAKADAGLHVCTGINRLGLTLSEAEEIAEAIDEYRPFSPGLIISHLACADDPDHPMNALQRDRFRHVSRLFPAARNSLANSGGILLGPDYHFALTRPGIALYGAKASKTAETPLETVVTLEARLLMVRMLKKGETIGYGARFTAPRDMRAGLVAIGYADGFLRRSGSTDDREGACFHLSGKDLPVVGRVSMDQTVIDVTHVAESELTPGMMIEVFGPNMAIDRTAERADTIGYEFLTALGRRFEREYIGRSSGVQA
ncbi:alanine racemase [Stappia sp. GBMRC 2046]|uniref:Alanine racemase n=1 Tax=Stappia sediminis TaxID=2692190 RepID=A0A7X3LSS7_9HYPH|nr:alanine racemase [Stappia sediminis]MXN64447.1 alanine racemase [Stappia sediminis]